MRKDQILLTVTASFLINWKTEIWAVERRAFWHVRFVMSLW